MQPLDPAATPWPALDAIGAVDDLDPRVPDVAEEGDDAAERDPLVRDLGPGFCDPTGTVHVWVDDDARLVRARYRLRGRVRARVLDERARTALELAQARLITEPWLPRVRIEPRPIADLPTREAIAERVRRLAELRAQAATVRPPRLIGGGGRGADARGRVWVVLDQLGNTASVTHDEHWADAATPAALAAALLAAHQRAYATFTPPQLDATDYVRHQAELQQLDHELGVLMSRLGPRESR